MFRFTAQTNKCTHSHTGWGVHLRAILSSLHQVLRAPNRSLILKLICWSYSLHQLYIHGTLFAIVSLILALSSITAYGIATPPQKQTVPTVSFNKKKKKKAEGKLGWSINLWDKKESENVSFFVKGNFHQRACPTLHRTDDELPLFSFLFFPILFSPPHSTIILIMFRQLNMPALTTAQIWGNWLICTIINVGSSP